MTHDATRTKGIEVKLVLSGQKHAETAAEATAESANVDFKERFNPESSKDWCEIVKDIVAMANSGGGCLVFGVRDDGSLTGWSPDPILTMDPATFTDKVLRYTGRQFANFEIVKRDREGRPIAMLVVGEVRVPIVFSKPGTYSVGGGRQKTAFAQGTVYFRHGAKSEPGTTDDLSEMLERRLKEERNHLLANVRRVFQAPPGHGVVLVGDGEIINDKAVGAQIRLTNDPKAPAFRPTTPDFTYPFRQKEVVEEVNRRLAGKCEINAHDILCVRRIHGVDGTKPEFFEKRKFSSPQYTEQFVDWLIEEYNADSDFFETARSGYSKRNKGRSGGTLRGLYTRVLLDSTIYRHFDKDRSDFLSVGNPVSLILLPCEKRRHISKEVALLYAGCCPCDSGIGPGQGGSTPFTPGRRSGTRASIASRATPG